MAEAAKIKKTAAKVLCCVEKVSSFASSIDPIFGVVSSLVGVVRKGMVEDEDHELDKDFQAINDKLEKISRKNHHCLRTIEINEVNENYSKYEEYIKHQYAAFNTMVAHVKKDPDKTQNYMGTFEKTYERDKGDLSLNVFYRGVVNKRDMFSRALLDVYLHHCDGDRVIMEHRCSHLAHLFHIGLISLMAYTAVTEDDEDEVRETWIGRMHEIQEKMQEALSRCKEKNSPEHVPTRSGNRRSSPKKASSAKK